MLNNFFLEKFFLAGVILPHDTFGSHLDASGRTTNNELDNKVKHLQCDIPAYNDFVCTVIDVAKHTVPRGFRQDYIPGWNKTCNDLHNSYKTASDSEMANQLLDELNEERRQKWHETAEMSFKQSSRKAWNLLHKLGSEANPLPKSSSSSPATANNVASSLVQMTKATVPEQNFKTVNRRLKMWKRIRTADPSLSSSFTLKELDDAIMSIGKRIAAGIDGIYPEFVHNFGL